MIAAVSWVPKGASKAVPEEAQLPSKEEIEEMIKSGSLEEESEYGHSEDDDEDMGSEDVEQIDEVSQALAVADALGKSSKSKSSGTKLDDIADGLKELDMDRYDDEDEGVELFSKGIGDLYYPSNQMDPYLKDKDDEDSEDLEDLVINANDAVIVCARNEDDVSHLEVYVYEEANDGEVNLYVHHHVIIPAFPLCMAWLDCPLNGGEKGNFMAVGSMEPSIEIWDLDIIEEVQPCLSLGGINEDKKMKNKKNKKGKKSSIEYKEGSHTDSVLGLAWNKEFRNILASASADKTVKIWDVVEGKCTFTLEHHTDKVQAIAWNHYAPQVLLSGSFDHSVVMKDARISTHSGFKWTVTSDVESLAWDPHTEHSFVVSLEDGTVKGFDIRTTKSDQFSDSQPSFTLHAHDKAVCSISYNPLVPNLLATGSTDKMVKLWDLSNNKPSCVASRNPKAGAIFSISFSEDSPFFLAIGGSKGNLEVWDTLSDAAVSHRFSSYSKRGKV
ncbi:periodic tryptophan protein 1 homolog [Mangifera indica]|uniref:periodic tryptophan protein 1 homolog n=1 Tax=Mangifera indica TaxID=29780 RepID=UPI001CFA3B50|nr:periodic tryptophan protein 1 homolog [Mangifera indica]XP_044470717.1 periodic tryptophan protein 1 homolog [Mangifera indica]